MKAGKIYDYRNKEEAKKLIGKKVLATDLLYRLENPTEKHPMVGIFKGFADEEGVPFNVALSKVDLCAYQFIREVIDEEEKSLMANRQLAEWLARGFGQMVLVNEKEQVDSLDFIFTHYNFREREGGDLVGQNIRIRSWDSNEWIVPTIDIYERDCKGIRTIE